MEGAPETILGVGLAIFGICSTATVSIMKLFPRKLNGDYVKKSDCKDSQETQSKIYQADMRTIDVKLADVKDDIAELKVTTSQILQALRD